ncbi:hypothetical protein Rs2_21416 [Raphanus sativus]|nr:hypothetical protein Rs2_21416 [Raphanus sativus]
MPTPNKEARNVMVHVDKILGFFPSSFIKKRHSLGISLQRQNAAEPCPTEERVAVDGEEVTRATTSRSSTAIDQVISPEGRSHRVSVPSRHFLESSTLFLLDPETSEGKKTLNSLF